MSSPPTSPVGLSSYARQLREMAREDDNGYPFPEVDETSYHASYSSASTSSSPSVSFNTNRDSGFGSPTTCRGSKIPTLTNVARRPSNLTITLNEMLNELEIISPTEMPSGSGFPTSARSTTSVISGKSLPSIPSEPASPVTMVPTPSTTIPHSTPVLKLSSTILGPKFKSRILTLHSNPTSAAPTLVFAKPNTAAGTKSFAISLKKGMNIRVSEHGMYVLELRHRQNGTTEGEEGKCLVTFKCHQKEDMVTWLSTLRNAIQSCPE
ncbi:hypothetical protein BC832DRAFT_390971 [Gaertneriomyces semiglobifer]|nr:hypothetical protein BC832DRAFT_390971 [Gaertneriomyces semiglobifer]